MPKKTIIKYFCDKCKVEIDVMCGDKMQIFFRWKDNKGHDELKEVYLCQECRNQLFKMFEIE